MSRAAMLPALPAASAQTQPRTVDWRSRMLAPVRAIRRSTMARTAYVRMFRAMQSLGVSVTPVHFYFPVPYLKRLSTGRDWTIGPGRSTIDFDLPLQLRRLEKWRALSQEWNFEESKSARDFDFHLNNGFFETVDAEVAYSIVRSTKPKRIIEVGGGNTTRLLASAVRKNEQDGFTGELVTIEPYPDDALWRGFPGLTQVIPVPVQDMPLEFFDQLEAGDILFIDSSHVVSLGSDVVFEMLEILPRLKPGVLIHFHDIFMPAEYPRKFVMNNLCFWGEQYMLQAFLCGNRDFRVVWSSSMMQFTNAERLQEVFPRWQGSYDRMPKDLKTFAPTLDGMNVWPCSLWIEKTARP